MSLIPLSYPSLFHNIHKKVRYFLVTQQIRYGNERIGKYKIFQVDSFVGQFESKDIVLFFAKGTNIVIVNWFHSHSD